ncbi:MAG: PASTA domain-containing protein [Blastocatellia bacterium]|nr:PASTA domain-containing protein [Blastocatellia bacterium]
MGKTVTIIRRIVLLGLLAGLFGSSATLTIWLLFRTREVTVPNTVGMTQQEAESAIQRAGLNFKLRRQHFDDEAPSGAVTEQDPAAGFPVKVGFDVKIDISKGPSPEGTPAGPPPVGPMNPADPPVDPKKKKDEKKDDAAKAAAKAAEEAKKPKADDDPGATKPADAKKPKDDSKPADPKPKSGDADAPPKPKPKPAPAKVPPHDD